MDVVNDSGNPALNDVFERLAADPSPELLDNLGALLRTERATPRRASTRVFSAAYDVLARVPAGCTSAGRVVALLCIASHYYDVESKPAGGLAPAADAVVAARALGDPEWLCRALKIHGVLLADTDNIPEAIRVYAEALDLARQMQSRAEECELWIDIGIACQYSQHFADAVACYERAIVLAGDDPALVQARRLALSNLANAALESGDTDKGLASIARAIEGEGEPANAPDLLARVHSEHYYTRLLLQAGLPEHAKQHARQVRRFADRSRSRRAHVLALIAEGLTEVHGGQVDTGLTRLQQALESSRGGMRATLHDALAALIKGYGVAGRPDAALVYLREIQGLRQEGLHAQVLMHHMQHLERIDRRLDQRPGAVLEKTQSALRGQPGERDLLRSRVAMLEEQSVAAELHEDSTGEHCYRVGRLASCLAADYGVDERTCFLIDLAARLHDIGKLAVPDGILLKRGSLTADERSIMQTHTTAGAELLARAGIAQLYVAEEIARHHHERFDGTGYPAGLKGTMIPLTARFVSLADAFDTLTHDRPYRPACSVDEALAEIAQRRRRQFDPELTDLFLALIERLQREHADLDAYLGEQARNSPFIRARRELAQALKADVNAAFAASR